jgi:hypothetical protein
VAGEIVRTNTGGGATASPIATTWGAGTPTAGNTLLCIVNSDTVVTTPSGWTILASLVNSQGGYVYTKTAAGTGDAPSLAFSPGTSATSWTLIELDASKVGAADVQAVGTETTTGNVVTKATTSITTTGANGDLTLAIALIHGRTGSNNPTTPVWTNSHTALLTSTIAGSGSNFAMQFIASACSLLPVHWVPRPARGPTAPTTPWPSRCRTSCSLRAV